MADVPPNSTHWDATNAIRLCDRCEQEYGVAAGADAGDTACSMCGQHTAPMIYPRLQEFFQYMWFQLQACHSNRFMSWYLKMKIGKEEIESVVDQLKNWGYEIKDSDIEDLIAEFDRGSERPDENHIGGFHRNDPRTSRKAAFDVLPRSGSMRRAALEAIISAGERGFTYEDVERITGIKGVWKRLSELKQGEWIEVVGQRKVSTGSEADVYRATRKSVRWFYA